MSPAGQTHCPAGTAVNSMKAIIKTSGIVLADEVEPAESLFSRLKGLLGRSSLPLGHALWLRPCNGVHTFGMGFSIDVVVLDRLNGVRAIHSSMAPWRMTPLYPAGSSVLELSDGTVKNSGLLLNDAILFVP